MNKLLEWFNDHPGVNVSFQRYLTSSLVEINIDNGYEHTNNGGTIKYTVSNLINLNAPKIEDKVINILNNSYTQLRPFETE